MLKRFKTLPLGGVFFWLLNYILIEALMNLCYEKQ